MDNLITTQWSVSTLVHNFEHGNIAVPEIQRDVVWGADQIKGLVDSISRGYPCGSLILWEPREKDETLIKTMIRPERLGQFDGNLPQYFLLDGQQRVSALASVMLSRKLLRELLYELEEDMPSMFANLKRFPKEIEATSDGAAYKFPWAMLNNLFDGSIKQTPDYEAKLSPGQKADIEKFVQQIRDYQFPIQIIRGRDYPTVGEIFARVNSMGTPLTGAEIHLASIVPHWPGITKEFRKYRQELRQMDYDLDLTFLMRVITSIECKVPQVKKLAERVSKGSTNKKSLNKSWKTAQGATDTVIHLLRNELLLDKTKFFTSKNVLVPLAYYSAIERPGSIAKKRMLRFFLFAQLSERYGAGAESVLKKDIGYLTKPDTKPKDGISELLHLVEQETRQTYRGLKILPRNIDGRPSKNVMLLLMYIVMRKRTATDFGTGSPPSLESIGSSDTQLHHIFPYNFMMTDPGAKLYAQENELFPADFRAEVNDIANLTFLSQTANGRIGDVPPWQYFATETTREMRKAHFIPENRNLWRPERFGDFLTERRKLLAKAMNSLLRSLR